MFSIKWSFFNKDNLPNFFENHFMVMLIVYVFSLLLMRNTTISPVVTIVSIFFLFFYSYFIHMIIHKIPKEYNPHILFHHGDNKNDYWFNWIIETIINVMFFLTLYLINVFLNLRIPNILILYYGMIYVSVHVINYSIFHFGDNHANHHSDPIQKCNFGPDTFDHFFNTNCNSNYENFIHMLTNILCAFLIIEYIKYKKRCE